MNFVRKNILDLRPHTHGDYARYCPYPDSNLQGSSLSWMFKRCRGKSCKTVILCFTEKVFHSVAHVIDRTQSSPSLKRFKSKARLSPNESKTPGLEPLLGPCTDTMTRIYSCSNQKKQGCYSTKPYLIATTITKKKKKQQVFS